MKRKQMTYETFLEVKRQKSLGVSQRQTAINLGLSRGMLERWWHKEEAEFLSSRSHQPKSLEQYREYILSVLKVYPQIRATNMYFKLTEQFSDFNCKRSTFFRFFSKLLKETGYIKYRERIISPRSQLPPGYEAQVDFGQYKLKDMYGQTVRVYFFCMVLTYSQMRFVYFSPNPFTTQTSIYAHELAFKFFNGRTQTIMYDLDRVFVLNENYGDIVFIKEFEDYVRETGFSTVICRPRDPQTKGRVENLIGYVKYSFLEGRTYNGIDALNSACLQWLDNEGNGLVNAKTRRIPREMFYEEARHLIPVKATIPKEQVILSVTSKNCIRYKGNEYALPKGKLKEKERVRVEERDNNIFIYQALTNEFLLKHAIPTGEGNTVSIEENYYDSVSVERIKRIFGDDDRIDSYIKGIKDNRYINTQCKQIYHLINYYSETQMMSAIEHCLRVNICNTTELAAYLIYKFGASKSKRCFSKEKLIFYSKRAQKIKEELDG